MAVAASCFTAFGACEYIAKDTAWVYKWKFSGKTTYGTKTGKAKAVSFCDYNGDTETCVVCCPASLKIEGYTWVCSPGCGSESFEQFSEVNEVFWQNKPVKANLAGGIMTEVCNIIGKNAKNCEVAGTAKFTQFCRGNGTEGGMYALTYAGLGKYDIKHSRIKSASGNFAGVVENPSYITDCTASPTGVWSCDSLSLMCENTPSVVYGKWSVKFQKSASKKYLKNGRTPKLPSWIKPLN